MKRLHIFLLAILMTICCCKRTADKLLQNGQRTDASVLGKRESSDLRERNRHYFLKVSFFAQNADEIAKDEHEFDVLKDTTLSMADRLDNWKPGGGGFGDFTTIEIDVKRAAYIKYKEGETVSISYLPEDPTVVKLFEELE